MLHSYLLPSLIVVMFIQGCNSNGQFPINSNEAADGIKTLLRDTSADGKKLLRIVERCEDTMCHTQVLVDFSSNGAYQGSAGVYAPNGRALGIESWWKDDNTIIIKTRAEYRSLQKWPQVQNMHDIVKVIYIEE